MPKGFERYLNITAIPLVSINSIKNIRHSNGKLYNITDENVEAVTSAVRSYNPEPIMHNPSVNYYYLKQKFMDDLAEKYGTVKTKGNTDDGTKGQKEDKFLFMLRTIGICVAIVVGVIVLDFRYKKFFK